MSHVRATTIASEMQYDVLWVCVCSPGYPVRNAHAPYCHLWSARLCNIFPHYLINGTIFENKFLKMKCVFWFSLQCLSETSPILRKNERDMIKNIYLSSSKVPIILVRFEWNLNLSTDFRKIFKYKISWKSIQWEPVVPCGWPDRGTDRETERRTDRHDEANNPFLQFCRRA